MFDHAYNVSRLFRFLSIFELRDAYVGVARIRFDYATRETCSRRIICDRTRRPTVFTRVS